MIKRLFALLVLLAALNGCGGGKEPTESLYTLGPGSRWVYRVTGTVALPASMGGGTQNLQTTSTLTVQAGTAVVKDPAGNDTRALDRKFDLLLLDGRGITATQRLYVSQNATGIFVHGMNVAASDTIDPVNDVWVPRTANPPSRFLYLPDPAPDGRTLSYTNPLGLTTPGDHSYTLTLGSGRQAVEVPAGHYLAKGVSQVEKFDSFAIANGGFVPDVGLVSGLLDTTLASGARVQGSIVLTSVSR